MSSSMESMLTAPLKEEPLFQDSANPLDLDLEELIIFGGDSIDDLLKNNWPEEEEEEGGNVKENMAARAQAIIDHLDKFDKDESYEGWYHHDNSSKMCSNIDSRLLSTSGSLCSSPSVPASLPPLMDCLDCVIVPPSSAQSPATQFYWDQLTPPSSPPRNQHQKQSDGAEYIKTYRELNELLNMRAESMCGSPSSILTTSGNSNNNSEAGSPNSYASYVSSEVDSSPSLSPNYLCESSSEPITNFQPHCQQPESEELQQQQLQDMSYDFAGYLLNVASAVSDETSVAVDSASMSDVNSGSSSPGYISDATSSGSDPDWSMPATTRPRSAGSGRRCAKAPNTTDDRKVRKKEQNKNAATRYRQKKKLELLEILDEEKDLLDTNTSLQEKVTDLQREMKYLKSLLRDVYKAKGLLK